jgi:hypothetical protein
MQLPRRTRVGKWAKNVRLSDLTPAKCPNVRPDTSQLVTGNAADMLHDPRVQAAYLGE